MYAVVETGGKQYRVAPGQKIRVERLEGEIGTEVRLDRVLLLVDDQNQLIAGNPVVEGASVTARIVEQHRTRKVLVFKYAKRKRRRVKTGHRQYYTALYIGDIQK
ncbi:MAG: 50S ribosomal protein L21 [Candidatus Xenobium sp.]|nr:50S ribosomal protein L21 [Burkholderiales bacterium]